MPPRSDRLIWIDCEMTGLDVATCKMLEIAAVVTEDSDQLTIVDQTESIVIHCDTETLDNMNQWCVQHHGASGLTRRSRNSTISCQQAETMVLRMLRKHTVKGECKLAGNRPGKDREFIDKYMPKLGQWLSSSTLDVTDIQTEAFKWWKTCGKNVHKYRPRKVRRHRALADIMESISEYRYYRAHGLRSPEDCKILWRPPTFQYRNCNDHDDYMWWHDMTILYPSRDIPEFPDIP